MPEMHERLILFAMSMYWVRYRDLRPQFEHEWERQFEKRYGKVQYANGCYTKDEAEKLKSHYERGGLSEVELVPWNEKW